MHPSTVAAAQADHANAPPPPTRRFRHSSLRPSALHHTLQLESQKRMVESTLRRAAFTAAQLDEMPQDVATYRSVGKA